MPDDPLAWAREQAARSKPAVGAAAMLWIARVQTALDPGHARITFEMAPEETRAFFPVATMKNGVFSMSSSASRTCSRSDLRHYVGSLLGSPEVGTWPKSRLLRN